MDQFINPKLIMDQEHMETIHTPTKMNKAPLYESIHNKLITYGIHISIFSTNHEIMFSLELVKAKPIIVVPFQVWHLNVA